METLNNEIIMLIASLVIRTGPVVEYFNQCKIVPDQICLSTILVDEDDRTFEIIGICAGGWEYAETESDCLDIQFGEIKSGEALRVEVVLNKLKVHLFF